MGHKGSFLRPRCIRTVGAWTQLLNNQSINHTQKEGRKALLKDTLNLAFLSQQPLHNCLFQGLLLLLPPILRLNLTDLPWKGALKSPKELVYAISYWIILLDHDTKIFYQKSMNSNCATCKRMLIYYEAIGMWLQINCQWLVSHNCVLWMWMLEGFPFTRKYLD
jgi:hypothetical protein